MSITLDRPAEPSVADDDAAPPQQRLRIARFDGEAAAALAGSFVGGLCLTWVIYERILPLSGAAGFWITAALVTMVVYAVVSWGQTDVAQVVDRLARLLLLTGALCTVAVVADLIGYTVLRGTTAITHANFWTETMSSTGPLQPLTSGGMVHALVGSLEQLGLATLMSVPLGITAALFLVEIDGVLARTVRVITEAMTALPEIVAGLFIYALFILTLGGQRSGLAASLALTVMMIPVVTRTSEVVLRLVPGSLREASYALGAGQASTVLRVVLPTARSGLATGVILAMARAVGETSPVLLTAGFSKDLNLDPFHDPQASLPLYIFNYVRYPQADMVSRAFGAGLALMIMVLVLFVLARIIGGRAPGEVSGRRRRAVSRGGTPPPAPRPPTVMAPGFPDPQS